MHISLLSVWASNKDTLCYERATVQVESEVGREKRRCLLDAFAASCPVTWLMNGSGRLKGNGLQLSELLRLRFCL